MFSSKRSLLALTLGIGLSLSACAAEQEEGSDSNVDFDLDADSPEMEVMGGGETLPPPGTGSGGNGARPVTHCLKAMVQTMSYFAAGRTSGGAVYNWAIDWVRCNDVLLDPNASSIYPKIPDVPGALETMTWAGAHQGYGIYQNTPQGWKHYYGPGWFSKNWAGSTTANLMDPAKRDILGGVLTAKGNFTPPGETPQSVPILLQAHGLDGSNTTLTSDPGQFTLVESMVVFDPDAPAVSPPGAVGTPNPSPGLYVFVADEFKAECEEWNFWFHRRMCHNGNYCGITYRPESEIGNFCKKGNPDGTVSTENATGIDDAYRCLGNLRPVKVRVKPGDISNNVVCNPLN